MSVSTEVPMVLNVDWVKRRWYRYRLLEMGMWDAMCLCSAAPESSSTDSMERYKKVTEFMGRLPATRGGILVLRLTPEKVSFVEGPNAFRKTHEEVLALIQESDKEFWRLYEDFFAWVESVRPGSSFFRFKHNEILKTSRNPDVPFLVPYVPPVEPVPKKEEQKKDDERAARLAEAEDLYEDPYTVTEDE